MQTITSLIAFLSGPISVIFCGRLGKEALATVGLAVSVFNVTGLSVITGLLSAADTLFSQVTLFTGLNKSSNHARDKKCTSSLACNSSMSVTYGSRQKHLMGVHLQRSCFIITICCFPCVAIYLLAEPFLVLLRQNPATSKAAAEYLLYMIPGLFVSSLICSETFRAGWDFFDHSLLPTVKYSQSMYRHKYVYPVPTPVYLANRVYPPLVIGVFADGINALFHYVLLFVVQMGVKGSAIAQVSAYVFQCVCLLGFIIFMEKTTNTWQGWTSDMWNHWGLWFKLATPGVFMTTLEWTVFEIGSIVAGTIGERELATQAILFNIESMCYTLLPLGFGMATSIRLGQFLGAGSSLGPRSVLSVALVTLWCTSVGFIIFLVTLRWYIPKIFTSDESVIELSAKLLPLVAAFQIFDGTVGVCSGAIRGAGLQLIGAAVCFVTLYVFGATTGLCMVFLAGFGLDDNIILVPGIRSLQVLFCTLFRSQGLWVGLTLGTVTEGLAYCIITQCINWEKQVQLAMERTRKAFENQSRAAQSTSDLVSPILSDSNYEIRTNGFHQHCVCISQNRCSEYQNGNMNKMLIFKRVLFIIIMLAVLILSICCRLLIPWSKVLGTFCVLPDGIFYIVNATNVRDNCTLVSM
ncbi:Multidrug and toxin extrusion protein [Fasciolopsis buskii]|uniref:Multidrug and toxin extrusion protein n=1 Tax=Fasciolopsis buskii TaxID=27845 RepID=A0A8E0RZI3_9TREM|nr:Multidrug and toxin extrusion protein [Fasciolopsis buski]